MKRFLCLLLVALLLVPGAMAEKVKELPQPDENGKTTYLGEVGELFDEEGNYIIESLFDEAVIWIEEMPEVYDACIVVEQTGRRKNNLNIAVVTKNDMKLSDAKELADSIIRQVGLLFGTSSKYDGPTKDTFGTIYDEYYLLIGIFTRAGKQICLGAMTNSWSGITW